MQTEFDTAFRYLLGKVSACESAGEAVQYTQGVLNLAYGFVAIGDKGKLVKVSEKAQENVVEKVSAVLVKEPLKSKSK